MLQAYLTGVTDNRILSAAVRFGSHRQVGLAAIWSVVPGVILGVSRPALPAPAGG